MVMETRTNGNFQDPILKGFYRLNAQFRPLIDKVIANVVNRRTQTYEYI